MMKTIEKRYRLREVRGGKSERGRRRIRGFAEHIS
jgi:hypothetical protein